MKIDTSELYSQRMLMFLEIEPQSNRYRQVILDAQKFKKVSDAIICFKKTKNPILSRETVEVELSNQEYQLPDLQQVLQDNK